jgi:MYXO-CTERM domain-containing protein
MLKSIKCGIGATLLAAAQLCTAGIAEIQVSNITLSVSGGEWWYWLPGNVDWLPMTAETSAAMLNPAASDGAVGWHGSALAASVSDGSSLATSTLTAAASGAPFNGVTASAKVVANDGQSGWAFSKLFDGQILVGGNATITLSATIDTISASGSSAQANAYFELCSTDFITDVCDFANYAEAFVDGASGDYSGPSLLTASWTNPGATTWAKMRFGLSASADADVQAVPEPASWTLALTALAGLGALRRKRPQAA